MSEHESLISEANESFEQPPLYKIDILMALDRVVNELGIDMEDQDVGALLGADDNDLIGNLTMLAIMHDIDPDEFLKALGVDTID